MDIIIFSEGSALLASYIRTGTNANSAQQQSMSGVQGAKCTVMSLCPMTQGRDPANEVWVNAKWEESQGLLTPWAGALVR